MRLTTRMLRDRSTELRGQGEVSQSSTGVDEGQDWKQGWEDRRQPRPRAEAVVSKGTHGKLNSGYQPSG